MAEIKRGYTLRDFEAIQEAKFLGPYPAWDGWKHALFNRLKEQGLDLPNNTEKILHEWYVLRREIQLGIKTTRDSDEFHGYLEENNPQIFDNAGVVEAFRFITSKTAIEKVKK